MTEEDEAWEMHEPKDGFSKQDEEDLLKMLQNMPIAKEPKKKKPWKPEK